MKDQKLTVEEKAARWAKNMTDETLLQQLAGLDEQEKYECFYTDLQFGTGGIRGVMGVGTNRMNRYVVGRATQGLANMLLEKKHHPLVVIGYDSRNHSTEFAQTAAAVLAENGVRVALYPRLMPTPLVSFAVRRLGADAGIMITASHNPGKYNGYKVFGADGCQMNLTDSQKVMAQVEKLDFFDGVKHGDFERLLHAKKVLYIDETVTEDFLQAVAKLSCNPQLLADGSLRVVYTPLNGAGNLPVRAALDRAGITNLFVVPEQEHPDGNFTTCPFPNPEIPEALALAIALAKEKSADLVLATDPDSDRVGIAVPHKGTWELLNGNEVGVLLTDYLLSQKQQKGTLPQNPIVVKTIVSTPLTNRVAAHYGATVVDVLTGFKFIGEQIRLLEQENQVERYQLGFEESYGYLAGPYARDKDAVGAALLICEMTAYHRSRGKDLLEVLQELYQTYGYYVTGQDNLYFEGSAGMDKMNTLMQNLMENPPAQVAGFAVVCRYDYEKQTKLDLTTGTTQALTLPVSKVLKLTLENACEVVVRPSGTEPKIKIYYTAVSGNMADADMLLSQLKSAMNGLLS